MNNNLKKLILELLEDEDIRKAVGEAIVSAPFNLESTYVPDFSAIKFASELWDADTKPAPGTMREAIDKLESK